MKQIYDIPIAWQSYKNYKVKADNLEEACILALKQFLSEPDENYVDDSFEIDGIIHEDYPEEEIDIQKIYSQI